MKTAAKIGRPETATNAEMTNIVESTTVQVCRHGKALGTFEPNMAIILHDNLNVNNISPIPEQKACRMEYRSFGKRFVLATNCEW